MSNKSSFPSPISILMLVIIIAAISTWLLPAGQYNRLSVSEDKAFVVTAPSGETRLPFTQGTLDSLGIGIPIQKFVDGDIRKPVSIPGTYQKLDKNQQGFIDVLNAPIKGIMESIDIILFILIIGGFMYVFNETGAMVKGITWLSHTMRGREPMLIGILTSILSFFAASYGMAEEALVFYPILVPLFLAAGYDLLVPLAIIFGGTSIGCIASFSNPFSVIIASNAAGINWMDGLTERLLLWVIVTGLLIWYILRYAAKVKKDPSNSLVFKIDGEVKPPYEVNISQEATTPKLELQTKLLLLIYLVNLPCHDWRGRVFKMVDCGNVGTFPGLFHPYCGDHPHERKGIYAGVHKRGGESVKRRFYRGRSKGRNHHFNRGKCQRFDPVLCRQYDARGIRLHSLSSRSCCFICSFPCLYNRVRAWPY